MRRERSGTDRRRHLPLPLDRSSLRSRLGFSYENGVAVAFDTTGRDFEIAITGFSPTVALATVVGPLSEVPVMLFPGWSAMRLRPRMFGGSSERASGPAHELEPTHVHQA